MTSSPRSRRPAALALTALLAVVGLAAPAQAASPVPGVVLPVAAKATPTVGVSWSTRYLTPRYKPVVRVSVKAGTRPASGTVRIYDGSKRLATAKLSKGRVSVTLPRLSEGKHTIAVSYAGSSTAAARRTTRTVDVRPTVVLDPGHNGGNAGSKAIWRLVPDGTGGRKACDTAGTQTLAGYAEHAFNWDVSERVRDKLRAKGIRVVMTRSSDTGVGPCVDVRGTAAQRVGADLKVSIHGDGSTNRSLKGFFVMVTGSPATAWQGRESRRYASELISRLSAAGFPKNSAYRGALSVRSDLAGLNLSTRPAVMVELGEMRNAAEAKVMAGASGRARYAEAVASAVVRWYG